jgi:eukaryotic-like serine/threonine-protein kinase
VVSDGRVFVSSLRHLTAFDARTGQQLWTIKLGAYQLSTPSVDGGKVYVTASQSVFAFDVTTGVQVWKSNLDAGGLYWPVIVEEGIALTFEQPGKVVALDASTGSVLWLSSTVSPFYTLSAGSGLVYIVEGYEVVAALDLATGAVMWRHEQTAENRPIYTGASLQGSVGFAASTEKLFAFDSATGDHVFDAGSLDGENGVLAVTPEIVLMGTAWFWLGQIGGFDVDSGVPLWNVVVESNVTAVGAANGVIYVSAGKNLYALDATTGTVLITIPFLRTAPGAPVITGGMVYVTTSHLLHAYGLPDE